MTGNTALGGSARSWVSSSASASATTASMPASARASRTRWPERSDTSRSADRPPARTTTRSSSYMIYRMPGAGPKSSRSSISVSITEASRRTPSRIRSGLGSE